MTSDDRHSAVQHPQPRESLPHVPRLSIAYLLFFTMVTAAVFSSPAEWEMGTPHPTLAVVVYWVVFRVLYGAGLTGLFLIAWHAARRTLWPLEPGEWLVVVSGGSSLLGLFLLALHSPLQVSLILSNPRLYQMIFVAASLGSVAFMCAVAIAARRYRWWSALIGIDAIRSGFGAAVYVAFSTNSGFGYWAIDIAMLYARWYPAIWVLELVLLAIAVILDRRGAPPRHWLHWLGVGLYGTTCLFVLVIWL